MPHWKALAEAHDVAEADLRDTLTHTLYKLHEIADELGVEPAEALEALRDQRDELDKAEAEIERLAAGEDVEGDDETRESAEAGQ